MGLFDFFKKKEKPVETKRSNLLLSMPMFNNSETFELDKVKDYLKSYWDTDISDVSGDNGTFTFSIEGEIVALSTIPSQVPWSDIEATAPYAYNWPTALKDLENHNSHILAVLMQNDNSVNSDLERFTIYTKVISSILATSNCLGVYQGSSSLLIPRAQYLDSAEALKSGEIPVDLWVYIGIRSGENGNSVYTYGLKAFDKLEMEVVNSTLDIDDIYTFISNICAYVINSNVTFNSGETLGYTADQKVRITKSKGQFVEGDTLKLEM